MKVMYVVFGRWKGAKITTDHPMHVLRTYRMASTKKTGFKNMPLILLDGLRTPQLPKHRPFMGQVDIPMDISKLINMQRLILAENLSLKLMTLDGNEITSLPDEMGQLVRLERLSISGNLLTCLPETFGSLRNLLLLNVSNNKLKSLPESIGSCFSLEELQANGMFS
ncbi:hypothetical protein ACJW30_09G151900 [Castanea mollissima]